MRLDTHLSQRMDQRMVLAPRMIQSMEILQLPIMALQERIQQELQENPVLEIRENAEEPTEGTEEAEAETAPAEETADPAAGELVLDGGENGELDFDRLEALSKDWEDHFNEDHRPSRNGLDEEGDRKHDAMQNMASRPQSLQDYLADQLAFVDAPAEQMKLVRFLITHIDENGYLTNTLEEIGRSYDRFVSPEPM